MKFTLEIELGNDDMQTPQDVAECLNDIVHDLRHYVGRFGEGNHCSLRDLNGNTVGSWEVIEG